MQFRLDLLAEQAHPAPARGADGFEASRMAAAVRLVAERSGWGTRTPVKGTGMGIGFQYSHRGYFAVVAEVTVDASKRLRVNKMSVAGDIGSLVINPMHAENLVRGYRTYTDGDQVAQVAGVEGPETTASITTATPVITTTTLIFDC